MEEIHEEELSWDLFQDSKNRQHCHHQDPNHNLQNGQLQKGLAEEA